MANTSVMSPGTNMIVIRDPRTRAGRSYFDISGVLQDSSLHRTRANENKKTCANSNRAVRWSLIVITFLCTMVGFKTDIYYRYPVVFILYYGILTAKITNKLIVATMTKSELRLTDPSLWSLVVLLLNQYYRCGSLQTNILDRVLHWVLHQSTL